MLEKLDPGHHVLRIYCKSLLARGRRRSTNPSGPPLGSRRSLYTLTQLRYDLRKMKGHGLLERDGQRYCYRLTAKGKRVAAMFVLFHQRICGPLANSLFHHRPGKTAKPAAKIEAAYHTAGGAIQKLVDLIAA